MARRKAVVAQAWVTLHADDPEAVSALAVARAHLEGCADLETLRKLRVFELRGPLPGRREIEALLHRSTQFYNPHKEGCALRLSAEEAAPLAPGERVALVWDRGGERRPAAERWWLHETGKRIEVREGVAWAIHFTGKRAIGERVRDLIELKDRRHGLLCNPHSQEYRLATSDLPLPWWEEGRAEAPQAGMEETR